MGATHSLPLPRYGCCIRPQNPNRCKENHSQMPRSKGGHRRNLSAAFSFPEVESCIGNDLVNINTATEEELMTLPGINRQTAQNITEYRRQIDGFRKVEDLALVSGVGATRLSHIRLELTVGKRGLSKNSSASSSGIDISMNDNVSRGSAAGHSRAPTKVNVNTSNVFQLMNVRFISQNLAENIVAYRDRKGPFTDFDNLLKVKGIKPEILSAIQPYLVLDDDSLSSVACADNITEFTSANNRSKFNDRSSTESRELQIPGGPFSQNSVHISKRSENSKNVLRLAAWNLDNCSLEKMENPGVREVVAMTLLENGFGIVAVQEVMDAQSLQKLVDELTDPGLDNLKSWNGFRGGWKYIISSPFSTPTRTNCHLAFLYDTSKGIHLTNSGFAWTTSSSDDQMSVPLFLAEFKVGMLDLTIANIYLDLPKNNAQLSEALVAPVASLLSQYEKQGSKNLVLVGHFGMSPESPAMASLSAANFCALISGENFTDVSSKEPTGSICTENMWMSQELLNLSSGKADVIRHGLTNSWIPNGMWGWGGAASSHCPFMTELSIDGSKNCKDSSCCATFIDLFSDCDV